MCCIIVIQTVHRMKYLKLPNMSRGEHKLREGKMCRNMMRESDASKLGNDTTQSLICK